MDKAGGRAFDWGVQAVEYTRFMTALDIVSGQAFCYQRLDEDTPRSASFIILFSSDATMTMKFVSADPQGPRHTFSGLAFILRGGGWRFAGTTELS